MIRRPLLWVLICLSLADLLAVPAPFERTLDSNAHDIQLFFLGLLALLLLPAWQSACVWQRRPQRAGK
jgi:hypothetical protein